jgi:ACS family hexuronate transporter-like MFS transporter
LGLMNASGNVGAIITPLFMPALALSLGWQGAFLITGACGLVWVAAWMLFVRGSAPAMAADPGHSVAKDDGHPVSWLQVLRDRRTWAIAGGKVFSDPVWWFLLFWAPDFFHRVFHLDMQSFAVPLALIYSAAAVGSMAGGFVSGRLVARGMPVIKARKTTMLVCALLVVPVPLALIAPNHWLAVAILGLTLAAHQGFSVNLFALTTDVTPSARVATTISIAALFGNLAGMGILRLAGKVIGHGVGYGLLFGMAAVAYLLALTWIHFVLPRPQAGSRPA